MPTTVDQAFRKRCVTRTDGVEVLTRPLVSVAAIDAGYAIPTPTVDRESQGATYPGCMTQYEFERLCENNRHNRVSSERLASAICLIAPNNEISRASLEEIFVNSSDEKTRLTPEEVDILFDTLDTKHKSVITGDQLMEALHGPEGVQALEEKRLFATSDGMIHLDYLKQKEKEEARLAEEHRLREERLAQEKKAKEKADKERAEKERLDKEKRDKEMREAKERDAAKQEKAKGCC